MSCRLDTLADTTFSCVCDMTETCRRHVADTTQNVAVWAKKRRADIRHMELSVSGFVLRVIERLEKRAKGDVATVLDDILSNARATKEEVKSQIFLRI